MRFRVVAACSITLIIAAAAPSLAQVQGVWTDTGAMLSPRELNADAPLNGGNVLAVGGVDGSGTILATGEIYNATTGVWASTASMLIARESFTAVTLKNGKVLVAGGLGAGATVLDEAELYDPATNSWWSAGNMSVARYNHTATLLGNGKVLVAGGCTASGCGASTAQSELYDPATNAWSLTGSLNTARYEHSAVRLKGGAVLAIGGLVGGAASPSSELYNPSTGSWSVAANTSVARYLNGTTLLADGKVLVTGGVITKYPLNSAELYDPASNTWSLTGHMVTGRYGHSSTLLADGTVIVAGGTGQSISCGKACTGYIPTPKAEIYSEAAGTFAVAANLNRAVAYQASLALANGRALVNGGSGYGVYCCQVVSNAEFYTPLTMTFSSSSLDFGYLEVGLTSGTQTVTVTNVSNHAATFASIASNGDFGQSNNCPTMLAPTQNCTITIAFSPTAAGTRTGAVILKDDAPGSPKQTIALTGVGEALALGFSPASLNLGSVVAGYQSAQSATLINDGSGPVTITGVSIQPSHHTFTQTNNCPATLAVQQSCTFQIIFSPPDIGPYKATLSVTNSAGSAATLKLTGTGLD